MMVATNRARASAATGCAVVAALMGAGLLAGCRGERFESPPRQFFPDMDDSPKWKPQSESDFYGDSRTMRPAVAGAVAFGRTPDPADRERADFLRASPAVYAGEESAGVWVKDIPLEVTEAMLRRGAERFNIYCSACHGYDGAGKGTVGQQWSYPLPSFHAPAYQKPRAGEAYAEVTQRDGFIFKTIREGKREVSGTGWLMPPYKHSVNVADAWAIVAHIRAMQETRRGTAADVPAEQRAKYDQMMAKKPGAAGGGAAAPAGTGAGKQETKP